MHASPVPVMRLPVTVEYVICSFSVALKRTPHGEVMQTYKMFELIAMRRPAIVSRTRTVEIYFNVSCFELFDPGDEQDLARAIRRLQCDPGRGEQLASRAAGAAEPYCWSRQRELYLEVVERLVHAGRSCRWSAWQPRWFRRLRPRWH